MSRIYPELPDSDRSDWPVVAHLLLRHEPDYEEEEEEDEEEDDGTEVDDDDDEDDDGYSE